MSSAKKKMIWGKFKSQILSIKGKSTKDDNNDDLTSKLNMDEEYKEVLRTTSYLELWSKVQGQFIKRTSIDRPSSSSPSTPPSLLPSQSSLPFYLHLSDFILDPSQDTIMELIQASSLNKILSDYFDASLEACNVCESSLRSIYKTRYNYGLIRRAIKVANKCSRGGLHAQGGQGELKSQAIMKDLGVYARLRNPLSSIGHRQFNGIHDKFSLLLSQLLSKKKKFKRRAKFNRFCKKALGYTLVISCTTISVALMILVAHSIVGVIGAPGILATCCVGVARTKKKLATKSLRESYMEGLYRQVDAAAKGVYAMINDFDTAARLVERLHNEVEHRKVLVDMCVKYKCPDLLREALRELEMDEKGFLEQMNELEEHVCLCVNNIKRSRKMVIQELGVHK